ncbi:MAG TPA: EAL domain-containing protein [Rhodocyclaceae bacterium]|nr:EAL domain-containing protein [Rhodocyclaceae bacterium]
MRRLFSSYLPITLLGLGGMGLSAWLGMQDAQQRELAIREEAYKALTTIRAQLDAELKATFSITQGLVDVISVQGDISQDLFAALSAKAIASNTHIRNIAIAPDNVIRYLYPLAGNEKALGVSYASIPAQYRTVLRAKELGRSVLSEPVQLLQGGTGLILRAPVFRRDPRVPDALGQYWGTVSIVARSEQVFARAGLQETAALDLLISNPEQAASGQAPIYGHADILNKQPVTLDLEVPGGVWQMAAVPRNGWPQISAFSSLHFRFGAAITLLGCLIGSLMLRHASQLRERNLALEQEIRERERAESALRLADAVYRSTDQGIVVMTADSHIVSINEAFTQITGYAAADIIDRNFDILFPDHGTSLEPMWASLAAKGVWQAEVRNRGKLGNEFDCWLTVSAIPDQAGPNARYVAVLSDISSLMDTQRQLEHMAHYDALTTLPNRVLFQDRLQQAIAQQARRQHRIALLMLDLDGFKGINDSHGHPVGDRLLQRVAARLRAAVRGEDTVARLGGDEFALILELADCSEGIEQVAHKLLAEFSRPFDLDGLKVEISTSIGIAIYPGDAGNAMELTRNADTAMYGAKESGRNAYRFYQAEMTRAAQHRIEMEHALRMGIERQEFEVWYQPQFDLVSRRITGAEALIRWHHDNMGWIAPAEFIPVAERTGLIVAIGELVLRQVCADGQRWLADGLHFGRLAVNVATPQIERGDLLGILHTILAESAFPARHLEVEITESVIMANAERTQQVLNEIQQLGISTAIDDFGTGYSSLAYLKELPIHSLKIDRAFIRDLPDNSTSATIARAIVSLGHNLGYRVIAEGIETEAQWSFLQAEGCDEGQGYLLARPMPAAQFESWIRNHTP